jgi:DNA-binding transcriptional MerR regulator/mannose-6-phosphate isomerase-like protein (cupin superfamily)
MLDAREKTTLRISDVSRHAGVSVSTIRVWEEQELLTPTYTQTGRRTYRQSDVETAIAIKRMRSLHGMKIAEIKAALTTQSASPANAEVETSEREIPSEVGANLRKLRLARRLTIKKVAEIVGVDPSLLASIERTSLGINMPLLKRLASFYGVTLNRLMGVDVTAGNSNNEVVMRDHGVLLPRLGLGVQMERLCSGHGIMACKRWKVEPGIHSNGSYRHEGEEFLVVISGEFEVTIENSRIHRLTKGDSLYFRSHLFHSWRNPGPETAELIWIGVGDSF